MACFSKLTDYELLEMCDKITVKDYKNRKEYYSSLFSELKARCNRKFRS